MRLSWQARSWLRAACFLAALFMGLESQCLPERAHQDALLPPLLDATLAELRQGLDSGRFTSVELVTAYLSRIEEVNDRLRAVTEVNPDALSIAAELDDARRAGRLRGPLHGIPVLVKNNIATDDAMNTTAGSYALLGARVHEDSTVIAKLRRAGAIILGKANMSQWASCRSKLELEGWSAHGGQTVGAYFPGHDPSGSSSGSAVAASVGLAWATLGTETGGSIIVPAHVNNVVGIKPTVGLVSRHLVIPFSERQDTVGPLARTVKDAAHLLAAIAGPDPKDNYTSAIPWASGRLPDYVAACRDSGLAGRRIGVPRALRQFMANSTTAAYPAAFESALGVMRAAGAQVIDVHLPRLKEHAESLLDMKVFLPGADFMTNVADKYLAHLKTNPHGITSLKDLRDFTIGYAGEGYPERDVGEWNAIIDQGVNNTSPEFWAAYNKAVSVSSSFGLPGALKNHSLDAIALPSPFTCLFASLLGTPVVSVPLGRSPDDTPWATNEYGNLNRTAPNLPFGIGFAGAAFSEETLIGMAYAFEQRTRVRQTIRPYVKPDTDLADVVAPANP